MKEIRTSILLCEDDLNFGMLLCDFLRSSGYDVDFAQDGDDGWVKFTHSKYDICIFDVMMPLKSGFELATDIRSTGSEVPIIFLSARTSKEDILEGYKVGGDDYITKPCSMEILIYKIESIMRRIRKRELEAKTVFQLGKLTYNSTRQLLINGEEQKHLSSRENELLLILVQHANRLVERSHILKNVWLNDNYFSCRSLSVYVNHLRKLLAAEENVKIMSVHGKGYKIVLPEE
ncbi:MAG: response regulator transcription factor [Paludibacter sp.]|nr:response regulator transcription factor [Bacteroidales bacterium]MCM1068448.1 response regulator transcription factor [Prevotella sp.]MCM1353402.1 response regulator transcription factor [Bacteroides sp.]MCM1442563.1 response regulator transcription factor [Muribaculum sp.]MCM1481408.1 response regulator transcription factor [Paludibacter sp.]